MTSSVSKNLTTPCEATESDGEYEIIRVPKSTKKPSKESKAVKAKDLSEYPVVSAVPVYRKPIYTPVKGKAGLYAVPQPSKEVKGLMTHAPHVVSINNSVPHHSSKPRVSEEKSGNTIYSWKEVVLAGQVSPGGSETTVLLKVNPGLNGAFPWLSQSAKNYEAYRFRKLRIEWEPTCPTTTPGTVIISPDYDPTDVDIATHHSDLDLMNAANAAWAPPYKKVTCKIDIHQIDQFKKSRYVREGIASGDDRYYDALAIWLRITGTSALDPPIAGYFSIVYECELQKPQTVTRNLGAPHGFSYFTNGTAINFDPGNTSIGFGSIQLNAMNLQQNTDGEFFGFAEGQYVMATWDYSIDFISTEVLDYFKRMYVQGSFQLLRAGDNTWSTVQGSFDTQEISGIWTSTGGVVGINEYSLSGICRGVIQFNSPQDLIRTRLNMAWTMNPNATSTPVVRTLSQRCSVTFRAL